MIAEKIQQDVNDEFENLKEALQIHLKPGFHVSQTKQFLQTHIPQEIVYKSETLLDTLLNYLMEDAREKLKTADVTLQNAFFDADFRGRVHEWARQLENQIALDPDVVQYTSDPRLKQGLIASGITFVTGTSAAYAFAPSVVAAIVAGIITILLAAIAFKITYEKASPRARSSMKRDIDQYLEASKKQVLEWLEKAGAAFEKDFQAFCTTNGFTLEVKPNE
jgi:hypothetical protein